MSCSFETSLKSFNERLGLVRNFIDSSNEGNVDLFTQCMSNNFFNLLVSSRWIF